MKRRTTEYQIGFKTNERDPFVITPIEKNVVYGIEEHRGIHPIFSCEYDSARVESLYNGVRVTLPIGYDILNADTHIEIDKVTSLLRRLDIEGGFMTIRAVGRTVGECFDIDIRPRGRD